MAQYRLDTRETGQPGTRYEVIMVADEFGRIINFGAAGGSIASGTSAFGEPIAVPVTPVVQLDGIYGYDARRFFAYERNGGVTSINGLMSVSTNSTANACATLYSHRIVRYRPGQGAMTRFTAQFSAPSNNHVQLAGFMSSENGLMIGYNGTQFGVLRRHRGRVPIHRFTITGAPTGTETVTVTLNGVAYTVSVTGTILNVVTTLGNATYGTWDVEYTDTTLTFIGPEATAAGGTFSLTTQVGGTLTATSTQLQAGAAPTDVWTYQTDWNIDTMDGAGPSQLVLNPQKLNVYQISFRWLGAGEIRYAIENSETGDMMFFHHDHYSNRYTETHLHNPSVSVGYSVQSTNSATANISVSGASMMGAIEGILSPTQTPGSVSVSRNDSMGSGSVYHILSLHNRREFKGVPNQREVIIKSLSAGASTAGSAPAKISVYLLPTYTANVAYYPVVNTNTTAVLVSNTHTTINTTATTYPPFFECFVASGSPTTVDLSELRIALWPGAHVAVAISSGSTIQVADAALTFIED